jgi:hypothetical protein
MSWGTEYFVGTFLPTLLASLFAIPWKILDHDTKSLEPFARLARQGGGSAAETILLRYDGLSGLIHAILAARSLDNAPVALSTLLRYGAALLSPLAAESVRLRLEGTCLKDSKASCTGRLHASQPVVHATQALLGLMGCAVFAYVLSVTATGRRLGFGVSSDPRSIAGMASLSLNPYLMAVLRRVEIENEDGTLSVKKATRALASTTFEFGYVALGPGHQEYAILVTDKTTIVRDGDSQQQEEKAVVKTGSRKIWHAPPIWCRRSAMLGLMVRLAGFGVFLAGLIFLIMWYRLSPNTDTGFERFMNSQSTFGVRFLFTCFGVLVGLGWGSIFGGRSAIRGSCTEAIL